ncbi:CheR family methyltransferase [Catalinimonas niigatensis]|uniref:CheR family methyltransferase n=1 Tax=Catalinimonas niigatensis TaxID=1397264 RepID=UPI0026668B58|nr:protein-glutamate O-methyltransferase CheR [Catalinimonas niigatensis]WPP53533.1 protein-glutamate O-methyltransferase CheR [Catalinimonas niigatensis]
MEYNYTLARLTNKEFELLSRFIYEQFGIKMPLAKKTLLECRLQKRLRALQIENFKQYIEFLFSKTGSVQELLLMANVVTTNKTDFFREAAHFNFLRALDWNTYFGGDTSGKVLRVWSAACSSGEEPYTLAMTLQELNAFDYQILGTDLSKEVLEKAFTAIYTDERVLPVPLMYKQKYFLKHKDPKKRVLRIAPELRKKVSFRQLNLMDNSYDLPAKQDIIFCRNVLIYFDRLTQEKVIRKLCAQLKEGGYLFIGHSESLSDLRLPLIQKKSTVYQKTHTNTWGGLGAVHKPLYHASTPFEK